MEALLIAILIIGGVIGAFFVLVKTDETLEKGTGQGIGDWFWRIINGCIGLAIGYIGIIIIQYGMGNDNPAIIIVGIIVLGFAGLYLKFVWDGDKD